MNNIITAFFIASGILTYSCSAEKIVEPFFECTETLENPYGLVSHISRSGPQYEYDDFEEAIKSISDLGINCIRTDLDCANITPVNCPSTTTRFDMLFSALSKRGINVCGIITNLKYDLRCWDDYPSYWRYVDTLVNRYDNTILAYEVLNEADRLQDEDITEKYNHLLKQTYKRVKAKNPNALISYSGISWTKAGLFNISMKNRAYDFFDIMNFHVYNTPENLISHFEDIKKNMEEYGWSKHVWLTETGYSTCSDAPVKDIFITSEFEQAIRLPKVFLISFAYGIDKVFWYNHRSSELTTTGKEYHFGITHADFRPKPAYYAYKTLIQMCPNGSTRPILYKHDECSVVKWVTPEGNQIYAVWAEMASNGSVLSSFSGTYYDTFGQRIVYKDAIKKISSKEVIYIVSNKNK